MNLNNTIQLNTQFILLQPVLRRVGFHEVLVRVEEDAPLVIDTGHPDRQDRGLQSGPETDTLRPLVRLEPDQEPDVIPVDDPELPIPKLNIRIYIGIGT